LSFGGGEEHVHKQQGKRTLAQVFLGRPEDPALLRALRVKSGDPRLPQYQQALQEAQDDLKTTKKKLVQLESERAKLATRLESKIGEGAGLESEKRTHQLLEKILDRLSSIEKRLEKLERQK
jgi:hypothetical protein